WVEERVAARGELGPQLAAQSGDDLSRALDGRYPVPGQGGVGGLADDGDGHPGAAALADADAVEGLLAGDDKVGLRVDVVDSVLGAVLATGLLVAANVDDDLPGEIQSGAHQGDRAHDLGGDAGLVVAGAAAPDLAVGDHGVEGRVFPGGLVA